MAKSNKFQNIAELSFVLALGSWLLILTTHYSKTGYQLSVISCQRYED